MQTVLITGAFGFVGTNVTLHFANKGFKVIALDNFSRGKFNKRFIKEKIKAGFPIIPIKDDVTNPKKFKKILRKWPNICGIIHLAANPGVPRSLSDPLFDLTQNVVGTVQVLELARSLGNVPVLFTSSNKVFTPTGKWKETLGRYDYDYRRSIISNHDISSKGKTPYGTSKQCAELYLQEYVHTFGVPIVINRCSCMTGVHSMGMEEQGWVQHFVYQSIIPNGKLTIFGNGKQVRDIVDARDIARLFEIELKNIGSMSGKIFEVGGGKERSLSLIESFNILEKITGNRPQITFEGWRPHDFRVYISDLSKIKKYWKPKISLEQILKDMVKFTNKHIDFYTSYYKSHGINT